MKILHISNNYKTTGGSDSVFFNTSALLSAAGHEVIPFAAKSKDDLPSEYVKYFPEGIQTELTRPRDFFRYIYNPEARAKMVDMLSLEGKFDVAHLHIYYGKLTASILSELKQHSIPIVQSLHEYKLVCPVYTMVRDSQICEECVDGSRLNLLLHRCKGHDLLKSLAVLTEFWTSRLLGDVRLIDRFICVSDFQRDLLERGGIPKGKLVRIHNFVDPNLFIPVTKNRQDYLLFFGRIEELKGIKTLIHAAKAAGQKLKIAGTGNWVPDMTRLISDIPEIEYLGFVSGEPLHQLVANAKAVVVPSEWYENCPMSVLEAKAMGTPVIGAKIGGIPELINDGCDGFLFSPGNVDALIETFVRLDSSSTEDMGHAAKEDIQKRFSPRIHLEALMKIYSDVIR